MCVRGQRPLDTENVCLSLSLAQYGTRSGPDRTKVLRFCLMTRGDPPPPRRLSAAAAAAGKTEICWWRLQLQVVERGGGVVPSWTGVRAAVVDPIDAGEAINRLETQRN